MAGTPSLFAGIGAQFFDNSGNPLTGGKIYSYLAGTTTPTPTYTTEAATVNHPNPIILDSAGRVPSGGEIWLKEGSATYYKFVLNTTTDVLIASYDYVPGTYSSADLANTSDVTKGDALVGFRQSNTGGNLTGSVGRTVHQKLQELVSVLDFGADPTGVADSTTAFNNACSSARNVYVPPGTYVIANTVDVYGNLYGVQETSIINLSITSATGLGFKMRSQSSIRDLTINRAVNVTPSSGAYGNAVVVGNYTPSDNSLTNNVSISNLTIVGSGTGGLSSTGKWNLITVIGNVSNFLIDNISISGKAYIPILCHWARRTVGASYESYHPHNGIVRNIKSIFSVTTDNNWGGIYLSAAHDIIVENFEVVNCARGITIATGDVGGYYAVGESKERVGSNLNFRNISIKNHTNEAFWIGSTTYPIPDPSGLTTRWFFTDNPTSISIDGLVIEQGADSTSQEILLLQWAHNVNVKNLNIYTLNGETTASTATGIYITGSVNVNIQGNVARQLGCRVYSGANINLTDCDFINPDGSLASTSGQTGIVAYGTTPSATVVDAVAVNGTTIKLAVVPCDIFPGLGFYDASGNQFVFANSGKQGDTNYTLEIFPASAIIASGATITIEYGAKGLNISDCSFQGYYRNVFTSGVSGTVPKNVSVSNCNFFSSGTSHVYLDDTRDVVVSGCYFAKGNALVSSSGADINIRAATTGAIISNNVFNPSFDTKSIYNIYILGTASGAIVSNNDFYAHNTDTATFPTASSVYLNASGKTGEADYLITSNFFGPLVVNQVLPVTSRRSTTIGSNRVGYASAAPTGGIWRQGDVVFNTGATSAGYAGWICTVAGSPGTWKTFGLIS
jgi:hypothetical protein